MAKYKYHIIQGVKDMRQYFVFVLEWITLPSAKDTNKIPQFLYTYHYSLNSVARFITLHNYKNRIVLSVNLCEVNEESYFFIKHAHSIEWYTTKPEFINSGFKILYIVKVRSNFFVVMLALWLLAKVWRDNFAAHIINRTSTATKRFRGKQLFSALSQ